MIHWNMLHLPSSVSSRDSRDKVEFVRASHEDERHLYVKVNNASAHHPQRQRNVKIKKIYWKIWRHVLVTRRKARHHLQLSKQDNDDRDVIWVIVAARWRPLTHWHSCLGDNLLQSKHCSDHKHQLPHHHHTCCCGPLSLTIMQCSVMLKDQSYLLILLLFMSMGITNNLSYRDVIVEEGHDYLWKNLLLIKRLCLMIPIYQAVNFNECLECCSTPGLSQETKS